uniref:NADH dehydrogenase [ubiquinone] 1 beta subcomplex subunit 9 n=1 Tax=Arcella intermedia TaxID=1963864 RepID=A0A6B2LQS9_9EUKA
MRQYKQVLVTLRDHAGFYREEWYADVGAARAQYEKHRFEQDPKQIHYLIDFGNKWLEEHKHWYPYRLPEMEDGSKYQRNMTVPAELCEDTRYVDMEEEIRFEFDNDETPADVETWKLSK